MKTMKQDHMLVLMKSAAVDEGRGQRGSLCRPAVRRLAVCAAVMQCLASVLAADPPPAPAAENDSAPAPKAASVPQGREMRRYQAFARQAQLPVMTATNNTLLEVGGAVPTDVTRLAQLSPREKDSLAQAFDVPVGVIDNLLKRVGATSPSKPEQVAQELRTAVIDYRFLQIEWDRYHPPTEGQRIKTTALAALQAGDLAKAWELYDRLRKPPAPAPPTNLRVIAQP